MEILEKIFSSQGFFALIVFSLLTLMFYCVMKLEDLENRNRLRETPLPKDEEITERIYYRGDAIIPGAMRLPKRVHLRRGRHERF